MTVKTKTALVVLALAGTLFTSCAPRAQEAPSAAALFERAKAAHGGEALGNLKTYRDNGTITIYQNAQVAAKLDYTQKYNFDTQTARIELSSGGQLAIVQQTTKADAWQWTPQSGTVKLPDAQAKVLRDAANQGFFALRAQVSDLTDLKYDGVVELQKGVSGDAISFKLNGAENVFVLGADGTWIGGKADSAGTTIIGLQSDYRAVSGLKVPFVTKSFVGGSPFSDTVVSAAQINPTFTDADFAQPK
jgi:hypothetical protein